MMSSALLSQLAALQAEVAKLREQVDALIAPDGALQRRIMRVLAERVAAQAEIGREQLDRDMLALRTMVFQVAESTRTAASGPEQYAAPAGKRGRS
jgi:chorismate mutase